MAQAYNDTGFWRGLIEITSSHPSLYHRLNNVSRQNDSVNPTTSLNTVTATENNNDNDKEAHERFMPK
jgi:hypothetical protein